MAYACRIEADSISPAGARITTFVLTYPRFVHAELLTHRMFSRNSSSSRAIPIEKMIEAVCTDPVVPVWWGKNQRGMQANESLTGDDLKNAQDNWLWARDRAVSAAAVLLTNGAHKQIVNRILEPWMWITVIVTSTEYANFFDQRAPQTGPMDPTFPAQPELQQIAVMMRDAFRLSVPVRRPNHLPFYRPEEDEDVDPGVLGCVCAARCARVSYLTHDGRRDILRDITLCGELVQNKHWSPLEHVAFATFDHRTRIGNFSGWQSLRAKLQPPI